MVTVTNSNQLSYIRKEIKKKMWIFDFFFFIILKILLIFGYLLIWILNILFIFMCSCKSFKFLNILLSVFYKMYQFYVMNDCYF